MDKKDIIASGMLEQYLLGELSADQCTIVENILAESQQVRDYYSQMESNFERMAQENAIAPPSQAKEFIMKAVANDTPSKKAHTLSRTKGKISYFTPIAAALAVIFLLSTFWMYYKWQDANEGLVEIEKETIDLRNRITVLEQNNTETQKWYQAINIPNTYQFTLKGNNVLPNSTAITYINHDQKTVILNPQGLPDIGEDKSYQMWADVDGEMINMGVILEDQKMVAMKYIEDAESVNITIEPKGGSDHPTVEFLISSAAI